MDSTEYLSSVSLDERGIRARSPEAEAERDAALNDLLTASHFAPHCIEASGPYRLMIAVHDNRLYFRIEAERLEAPRDVVLPVKPFKRIIKDYFLIYESHLEALHARQTHRIEAIDMARRGIHNEGAEKLCEQLKDRISLDFDTARRLFTLICVLHLT